MYYLLALLIFFFKVSFSQIIEDSTYLMKNSIKLDSIRKGENDLRKINIVNSKYQYFFFGEIHRQTGNAELQCKNIEWLSNNSNCNDIILELPFSEEERMNKYVISGDTNILNYYYKTIFIDDALAKEKILNKIREIYLHKNPNIRIRCIDVESSSLKALMCLADILNSKKKQTAPPISILPSINRVYSLRFKRRRSEKSVRIFVDFMKNEMINKENDFREYLGNDYHRFYKIISGMSITNTNYSSYLKREDILFSNIVELIKDSPYNSFYINLGIWHTTLIPDEIYKGRKNLCSMLGDNDIYKNKICSLYPIYKTNDKDEYFTLSQKQILFKFCKNDAMLIRLDGENSPYKELSEKFQYIVVW